MAIYVAKNGQLQTVKGIYYGMTEDYINATLFHNLVPKTATEIKFLYASDNPDLTGYQRIGYADTKNFIEVWKSGTKYILINPKKNYIYAPINCYHFLHSYTVLKICNIENFNTNNVTTMSGMFESCNNLTSLDLSNFDTQNVTNMNSMFSYCWNLTSLNISNFNTANVTNMSFMFRTCNTLRKIYSQTLDKTTLSNSTNMFLDCPRLVGGNGTTYDSAHTDADYARVDGEGGQRGYFTAPTN